MAEEKKTKAADQETNREENAANSQIFQVSETWAQEIIEDLDDFIESQGIYLRQ